jgi:hypothetical protein
LLSNGQPADLLIDCHCGGPQFEVGSMITNRAGNLKQEENFCSTTAFTPLGRKLLLIVHRIMGRKVFFPARFKITNHQA